MLSWFTSNKNTMDYTTFTHLARVVADFSPVTPNNPYNEMAVKTWDILKVLHEYENGTGWSLCENIKTGKKGIVPTSFFQYVKKNKKNPNEL
jgi:hypothetical protein